MVLRPPIHVDRWGWGAGASVRHQCRGPGAASSLGVALRRTWNGGWLSVMQEICRATELDIVAADLSELAALSVLSRALRLLGLETP